MNPLPKDTKLLEIEGNFQVVAEDFISENSLIGLAFVEDDKKRIPGGFIATALGSFLLHAENPNCMLLTTDKYWTLWTVKDIYIHHPLSINYKLYF
jgi:hypothetical protein